MHAVNIGPTANAVNPPLRGVQIERCPLCELAAQGSQGGTRVEEHPDRLRVHGPSIQADEPFSSTCWVPMVPSWQVGGRRRAADCKQCRPKNKANGEDPGRELGAAASGSASVGVSRTGSRVFERLTLARHPANRAQQPARSRAKEADPSPVVHNFAHADVAMNKATTSYRFDRFELDSATRQLLAEGNRWRWAQGRWISCSP